MNKKGFTLIEILVSVLIMSLVMTGLASIFIASKRHILHTRSKIQAAELGRLFLAPLQMDVTMSERSSGALNGWNQDINALKTGTRYCDSVPGHAAQQQPNCPTYPERTLDGIEYRAEYTIARDIPIANVNKVKLTITWSP